MAKGRKKKQEDNKIKVKSLFDHLHAITRDKPNNYWESLSDADKRTWSNYMILRFLSMDLDMIYDISQMQPYIQELKPKHLYKLFYGLLPKSKTYFRYVKGDAQDNYEDWLVELIRKHYEVSKDEAIGYLEVLYTTNEGKNNIKEIAERYGTDPKLITKLKLKIK